jgi:leucyl-tRNA synthetase
MADKLVENADVEIKSFERRNRLRAIEQRVQKLWEDTRAFEVDAGEAGQPKFLVTFPYPYMNGVLHVGHAFTISKAEFAAGFQRLQGKRVLFPFGFHCTGMPIAAAAKKIKLEIELFGNPPVFPADEPEKEVKTPEPESKKSKSKVASKASKKKYQWQILEEMGVPSEKIASFADPETWLHYFPPIAMVSDLECLV